VREKDVIDGLAAVGASFLISIQNPHHNIIQPAAMSKQKIVVIRFEILIVVKQKQKTDY
jgi:hypothetical protein